MNLLIFLIVLSFLIVVHEFGHFWMAKKAGVKVEKFSLGFGRKLYSWVHDGTEFMICAIPLGGYVKMAGDERNNFKGARDEYLAKPAGLRALIVLMGPVVNYALAYVCFVLTFMIGYVDMEAATRNLPAVVGSIQQGYPAKESGLLVGDKILQIDSQPMTGWNDVYDYITATKSDQLNFMIEREHKQIPLTVLTKIDAQKDIFGREHKIRRVGIGPKHSGQPEEIVVVRYGFVESLKKGGAELFEITVKTYQALYEMAIGLRSPKEAMGIVGMFYVIKFAISVGFSLLLHMIGIISASLAIFNLLPIIPLDGGHLFLIAIEKLRGKALPLKIEDMIARVGLSFILCFALFVFYADFERVGWIDNIIKLWKG